MGGDTTFFTGFTSDENEEEQENSSVEQELQLFNLSSPIPAYIRTSSALNIYGGDKPIADDSLVSKETDRMRLERWLNSSSDSETNQRRHRAYRRLLETYDELKIRMKNLGEAKGKILSYTPGSWLEKRTGLKISDYDVPETTSLILIGPKGCGKSSLVNRISKVFEDDKSAPDRAQVTYNSASDGTYFLQEYLIPRHSTSFCLYDTRSLCDSSSDNIKMIKQWMVNGLRHGEPVIRKSDSSKLKTRMNCKARQTGYASSILRKVNFAIFVVNGLEVLKSMDTDGCAESQYISYITETFSCPYLSFKDDKPVVAITHGDLLSLSDIARLRLYLGELLGVPPDKQIFDIPENRNPVTELAIVDLLRYSLEHADRNLTLKVRRISWTTCIWVLLMLGILVILFLMCNPYSKQRLSSSYEDWMRKSKTQEEWTAGFDKEASVGSPLDWNKIRHLWLDDN